MRQRAHNMARRSMRASCVPSTVLMPSVVARGTYVLLVMNNPREMGIPLSSNTDANLATSFLGCHD